MLQKAGRYQIIEELGRGAMGVVYRGFDPTIGRTVAIKTIHLDTRDPEMLMRFRREAQAAGALSHPNIVTIYDAGEDQGVFYIAMEHVHGETLQARLTRGALPFDEALKIIQQVGGALDHAHARQVIHRDVKPANIMLTLDGTAKVMDFGVAKLSTMNMTTTGQILGTPSYLSPEMVKGLTIDGRSDIFSLGVVLYEMLSGTKPFTGDAITTIIYKILEGKPDAPTSFKEQLHPGMKYVLDKVLAKDPDNRYQTCTSLATDLKNYPSLDPQLAAPEQPVKRAPTGTVILNSKDLKPPPALAEPSPSKTMWTVRPRFVLTMALIMAVIGGATVWGLNRFFTANIPPQQTAQAPAQPSPQPKPAAVEPTQEPIPTPAPVAAPATPPKPAAATLIPFLVTSNVDGARIFVDGETQTEWITPQRIGLKSGQHRVELRKPGYKTLSQVVVFTENRPQSKNFELEPLAPEPAAPAAAVPVPTPVPPATPVPSTPPVARDAAAGGRLQILTNPAGATILVDGERTNYKTPVNIPLTAGTHTITLEHRCCEPLTREIVVQPNQILPIREQLQPTGQRRRLPR